MASAKGSQQPNREELLQMGMRAAKAGSRMLRKAAFGIGKASAPDESGTASAWQRRSLLGQTPYAALGAGQRVSGVKRHQICFVLR